MLLAGDWRPAALNVRSRDCTMGRPMTRLGGERPFRNHSETGPQFQQEDKHLPRVRATADRSWLGAAARRWERRHSSDRRGRQRLGVGRGPAATLRYRLCAMHVRQRRPVAGFSGGVAIRTLRIPLPYPGFYSPWFGGSLAVAFSIGSARTFTTASASSIMVSAGDDRPTESMKASGAR